MDRDWIASFSIRVRNGACIIILDKKYNIANSSCHFGSYGSIWTSLSPKIYYMDLSWGPYNIFLVTDRSIYCHMSLSAMNYLLCICSFSVQLIAFTKFKLQVQRDITRDSFSFNWVLTSRIMNINIAWVSYGSSHILIDRNNAT
jgi:hypothetical protein